MQQRAARAREDAQRSGETDLGSRAAALEAKFKALSPKLRSFVVEQEGLIERLADLLAEAG
jgi:hypothetical protein